MKAHVRADGLFKAGRHMTASLQEGWNWNKHEHTRHLLVRSQYHHGNMTK